MSHMPLIELLAEFKGADGQAERYQK